MATPEEKASGSQPTEQQSHDPFVENESKDNGQTAAVKSGEDAAKPEEEFNDPSLVEDDEGEDKKKKEEEDKPKVSIGELFKYSSGIDKALMIFGAICAFFNGAGMPSFSEVFGRMVGELASGRSDIEEVMEDLAVLMVYIGLIVFLLSTIQVITWMVASEQQISRIRMAYFSALLNQECAWHDVHKPGELTARLTGDTKVIKAGMNDKVASGIMNFSMFLFGFGFGFYRSWQLTLLMLGTLPFLAIVGIIMTVLLTQMTEVSREGYATAGDIADEVLSNIRTVQIFGSEDREGDRFEAALDPAVSAGIKKEFTTAIGMGASYCIMFMSYALAFWFASYLIEWGENDVGEVTAVFFAVLIGSFGLGLAMPTLAGVSEAQAAAFNVYGIIDRDSPIDAKKGGKKLDDLKGEIKFEGIKFSYPTRQDEKLFQDLSVTVEAGTTVAFSGASGCGKSSVISLLQRQYDPTEGRVLVDGVDLKELDLEWWRSVVGVVSQEPNLFSGSIADNIRFGKQTATIEEIQEACKKANIHDTIEGLPDKYDTSVGTVGSQLSGGQKQRIAIARAIVKRPRILILDEATSALDRQSEVEVQAALDDLVSESEGKRTTFVIAHRLVTIRNTDRIHYVVHDGVEGSSISESGSYDELMEKKGDFYMMASRQSKSSALETDTTVVLDDSAAVAKAEAVADEEAQNASFNSNTNNASVTKTTAVVPVEEKTLQELVDEEVEKSDPPLVRLIRLSGERTWAVVLGLFGSLISGGIYPAYAVVLAKMLEVLGTKTPEQIREESGFWAGMFAVIGLSALVGWFFQGFYGYSGEHLTKKLRAMVFRSVLTQDQTFFDMPGRDPGGIGSTLSGDTEAVHLLWGPSLGYKIQMLANIITGLTIAFVYSWKIALVTLSVLPVMIVTGAVQQLVMTGFGSEDTRGDTVVSESLANVRTVMAFNMINKQTSVYNEEIDDQTDIGVRNGIIAGIVFGFSQFSFYGVFALAFWYGGTLMADGEVTFSDVLIASMAVLMGAMGAGEAGGFASKTADAGPASKRVFAMIDRQPSISAESGEDTDIPAGPAQLDFHKVKFIYPARPKAVVLKKFTGDFGAGAKLGLMGSTGCGKSTLIQLLARYYDPASGTVSIGGKNLKTLKLREWRKNLSVVLQEPSLFDGTIMENILYGRPGATEDEVFEVARLASLHDEVLAMKKGYETRVGYKGRKLSGGQKQRVAIARGLLRHPKLLLLDEATSALDNATEARVQDGIAEFCQKNDTTIVSVAHRLTTIRQSDKIILLDAGVILEQGSHDELMAKGGEYKVRWESYQAGLK